jgi:radical SAM superfamily enzyme YgiQ (UPF0313 family)
MKIALLDLNHMTRGVHTNTVPLGLGLISRYLQSTINHHFEIKIFKETNKAMKTLSTWHPDVIGISQYSWNSKLNLHIAKSVKKTNPNCSIIAGGPNADFSNDHRINFFKNHPFIDIFVSYDGEIPFTKIVSRLISGESIANICKLPAAGTYSFDAAKNKIIESVEPPPRLKTLDVFGAMYADGFFNELLDDGFHPFLQTHRGCPFSCAFCHTSDQYYSRMLFISPDIFRQDLEYLGKRFASQHDVTLYLANTNMSLFKEDFAIAKIIRQTQKKYDWPKLINVNSGKDPQKLLKMLSVVNFRPGIALQTLTSKVLTNIKRKNIPFQEFIAFQHSVTKKTGETSATELILCLPGETKKTFLETIRTVLNSGVQDITIYTLMHLKGTPLSSEENAKQHKYMIRHRVVPRQFSLLNGEKILDTEEVIVGTNTMPFDDYLELRKLCFTITAFYGSTELEPLKRLLTEYNVNVAQWIFNVHDKLPEIPDLNLHYKDFTKETKQELFPTREALIEFFSASENFQALYDGRFGDNLLRKYKCMMLSKNYKTMLKLAISEASKLLNNFISKDKTNELLDNMALFLSTREIKEIFDGNKFTVKRKYRLNYNIPKWMTTNQEDLQLENFHGTYDYIVNFDKNIQQKFDDFIHMNKDPELSLQILYRDGSIKELWPKWKSLKKIEW